MKKTFNAVWGILLFPFVADAGVYTCAMIRVSPQGVQPVGDFVADPARPGMQSIPMNAGGDRGECGFTKEGSSGEQYLVCSFVGREEQVLLDQLKGTRLPRAMKIHRRTRKVLEQPLSLTLNGSPLLMTMLPVESESAIYSMTCVPGTRR